jgi:hypothetical protein
MKFVHKRFVLAVLLTFGPPSPSFASESKSCKTFLEVVLEQGEYYGNKAREIGELDWSNYYASRLRISLFLHLEKREAIFIPLNRLRMIHPITRGAALEKLESRIALVRESAPGIRAAGKLSMDKQMELLPSKNPLRAIRDAQGNFVIFDGNGRLEALKQGLGEDSDLPVEVEHFVVRGQQVQGWLERVMSMRDMSDQ